MLARALIAILLASATMAWAHDDYQGYSGAPGSSGTCASSCHGTSGGTITVSGFPTSYVPGQSYIITVRHLSGSTIRNFNASTRMGSGSQNAGTISGGLNTGTYSVSGETNGVCMTTTRLDSAKFNWTAPAAGAGDVQLYLAGLQGSYGGANTSLVLSATEATSSAGELPTGMLPSDLTLGPVYPNPFNATVTISFMLPQASAVRLALYDVTGREAAVIAQGSYAAGSHSVSWIADNVAGGLHFLRLTSGSQSRTAKLMMLK